MLYLPIVRAPGQHGKHVCVFMRRVDRPANMAARVCS